ncbi:MAG: hypothetical protein AABZ06_02135 [Bdellovibrionota bacterium]
MKYRTLAVIPLLLCLVSCKLIGKANNPGISTTGETETSLVDSTLPIESEPTSATPTSSPTPTPSSFTSPHILNPDASIYDPFDTKDTNLWGFGTFITPFVISNGKLVFYNDSTTKFSNVFIAINKITQENIELNLDISIIDDQLENETSLSFNCDNLNGTKAVGMVIYRNISGIIKIKAFKNDYDDAPNYLTVLGEIDGSSNNFIKIVRSTGGIINFYASTGGGYALMATLNGGSAYTTPIGPIVHFSKRSDGPMHSEVDNYEFIAY